MTDARRITTADLTAAIVRLRADLATATRSLENVRALALRMRKTDPANAEHLLRFCREAGVEGSILREERGWREP